MSNADADSAQAHADHCARLAIAEACDDVEECHRCDGLGWYIPPTVDLREPCPRCLGTGFVTGDDIRSEKRQHEAWLAEDMAALEEEAGEGVPF